MGAKGIGGGVVGAIAGFAIGGPIGAVALGSAGFSAGEGLDGADKAVGAAKANKALINAQADEVAKRAAFNKAQMLGEGVTNQGEQIGAMVRGGVDVSSQSSLVALENAHAKYTEQAYFAERDALMQASTMRTQAQMQVDAAKRGKTAAQIGAGMSVLGAGVQAYMFSTSSTKPPAGTFQGGGAVDVTGTY